MVIGGIVYEASVVNTGISLSSEIQVSNSTAALAGIDAKRHPGEIELPGDAN